MNLRDTEKNVTNVDVASNRSAKKYSTGEQFLRVLWWGVQPLFRFSPRPFFGWRNLLLRIFGAKVGQGVHICPSARIFFPWMLSIGDQSAIDEDCVIYNLGPLTIGKRVTISRGAYLCGGTHDYKDPLMKLIRASISLGDECWICTQAYIGPGTIIHGYAIVGARAVVVKDVEGGVIVGGNPARTLKNR